jgi:hypothetical protein
VDQDVVQPLQERLHALLDTLRSRLDAEYARNVAAKRELITRAERLVTLEDTRAAIDEVRSLQAAWKSAGPVPRREDEALWTEFRRHCDAVFERSSQQRASHEAALGQQHARASALCEEAEQLADGQEADPATLAKRLAELGAEFDTLELPRSAARDLRRRFARAQDRGEERVRRARARAVREGWVRALDAGDRVWACAAAVARRPAADEYEPLRVAAAESVAALDAPQLRAARATLERQLEAATPGASGHDPAAGEDALRTICVRAELLAGLDTPPEDAERRREYQMRRLVEAMGQGNHADPGDLEALVLDWLEVGPVEPATQVSLRARFERCIEALA